MVLLLSSLISLAWAVSLLQSSVHSINSVTSFSFTVNGATSGSSFFIGALVDAHLPGTIIPVSDTAGNSYSFQSSTSSPNNASTAFVSSTLLNSRTGSVTITIVFPLTVSGSSLFAEFSFGAASPAVSFQLGAVGTQISNNFMSVAVAPSFAAVYTFRTPAGQAATINPPSAPWLVAPASSGDVYLSYVTANATNALPFTQTFSGSLSFVASSVISNGIAIPTTTVSPTTAPTVATFVSVSFLLLAVAALAGL